MNITEEQKRKIIEEQEQWNHYCDKSLSERRSKDMFFTPPKIIFKMIGHIDPNVDKSNYTILDCTCGSGNLLAALAICGLNPKNLYGNEYDGEILKLARFRLSKLGVPTANIHRGDATNVEYIKKDSFNENEPTAHVAKYETEKLW